MPRQISGSLQSASTASVPRPAATRRLRTTLCHSRLRSAQAPADARPRGSHQRIPLRLLSCSDDFSSATGFMAAWAIGQTERFRAALVSAGVVDWGMLAATEENGQFEAAL